MIFRIDDVSQNTDMFALFDTVQLLKSSFHCEVWLCVNPFSRQTHEGSVYPSPPFKTQPKDFFYNVNQYLSESDIIMGQDKTVSHGLFHADHSQLQYDAQEMSIVGSCNILRSEIFVPPFNRYNEATEAVCRIHKITLIRSDAEGWRSLEHEPFDPSHALWYFHPWRYTKESFKHALSRRQDVSANSI